MNKHLSYLSLFLLAFFTSAIAQAEIYKQVDAEGNVTYSNVKLKGAKKLDLEPADTSFGNGNNATSTTPRAPQAKTPTPSSFPKVDANTQNQRDNKRKDILLAELESEKKALENAKKAQAEGAQNPEVYKGADGKTFRNVAKFNEKMQGLQTQVDVHQRNIELLTKEIDNIN
jgi:Domain of unknown function (DUF4124)